MWSFTEHPGKFFGSGIGFFFGLLFVIIGFWRAVVLTLFIIIGFVIGKRYDEHKNLGHWLDKFFQK